MTSGGIDENDVGIQCRRNRQSEISEIRQNWRMEREKRKEKKDESFIKARLYDEQKKGQIGIS